jgi:HAD superfamily phosphoserine phosphatase-like hydrolase
MPANTANHVTAKLSTKAGQFIDAVLRLHPKLATFDCDGTLWRGDAGEGFFDWELKRGLVSDDIVRWARPRYADYKAGKVDEETMCGEMVIMHRGLREAEVQQAAQEYFDSVFLPNIFPEMRELIARLEQLGCEVWAVSSSNLWIIRACAKHFGIDEGKILAATAEIENGRVTDRLIRVPTGEAKPQAIRQVIKRTPDAAFGNSRWDTEMLAMARAAFAVNANPDLKKTAVARGWTVHEPDTLNG